MSASAWTEGGATFSPDHVYRHHLWRARPAELIPGPRRRLFACMLNPSDAGADPIRENDPTIRKWMGFCERWKFSRFDVCNLSDFCATKPAELYAADFPISPYCDSYITACAARADLAVVAWGGLAKKIARARAARVLEIIRAARPGKPIHCIRRGKGGIPVHPVMEGYTMAPDVFEEAP